MTNKEKSKILACEARRRIDFLKSSGINFTIDDILSQVYNEYINNNLSLDDILNSKEYKRNRRMFS